MEIRFESGMTKVLKPELVLKLFKEAGIDKPNWTAERIARSLKGSSVVISAWDGERLVGLASAISDFAWIAYLSQLAVTPSYQGKGLGKKLLFKIREEIGDEASLIVHSADSSVEFYKAAGLESYSNVFRLKRQR